MIQYTVTNVASGKVTNRWNDNTGDGTYYEPSMGKPLRSFIANQDGAVDGEDVSKAISSQQITDPVTGVVQIQYTFAAEYTVTSVDLTAQIAMSDLVQKGLQTQAVGAEVVATVYAFNEQNLASGALTSAQFTAMLADTTINNIERLLWNGSLATALSLVQSYNATLLTYFTADQIASIEAVINDSGLV